MKIKDLMKLINKEIPLKTAESWDNVGLIIGDNESHVTGILTTLDCTKAVVEEALTHNINTIICHHPLIFKGIQSIHNTGYGEVMHALIKNEINLIALHTNLDAHPKGVSAMIAEKLALESIEILLPENHTLCKLQLFVPKEHTTLLKNKLAEIGAGSIGDYDHCFFSTSGQGEFFPNDNANPFVGIKNEIHYEDEIKLECVFAPHLKTDIIKLIHQFHPYETPAFDIFEMTVPAPYGTGVKAQLSKPMLLSELAQFAKSALALDVVKIIGEDKRVSSVAIIGGAGVSYMYQVQNSDVDVLLTGDIKYHEAHDLLMMQLPAIDITHYSEWVMKEGLKRLLDAWIDAPILASNVNTNPFKSI
ncbi:Nif3-like dinuclear metal center hexameric protein [Macrococcoides caseolyticum]|uniref:Nif3-like dinuclear metal center hexameric protein n=1 Tax=Macrococcoides caseolyticum TaxID=69966 RepID=UPI001EEF5E88|nr:Nif3-like dinuclear metal center hexameric protein [Macrococcus caseolyticus]MCE4956136.1 Nif3-like dinuclear metal center hexameric protein [Macrococcus caseolyticus]